MGVTTPLSPNDVPHEHDRQHGESPAQQVRQGLLVAAAVAVLGVAVGLLWLWLAPRVPMISDGKAVYLANSEGEESIAADGTFALLGAGAGVLAALAVFWRLRRGGIAAVLGLAAGSLVGSVLAWQLGVWLGPGQDLVALARAAGEGKVFEGPLVLRAEAALLVWPSVAMLAHLGLTAAFGPEDPEWALQPMPEDWTHRNQPPSGGPHPPPAGPHASWPAPDGPRH